MRKREKKPAGFTLIELLVVVAVITILAAIAIPQYGLYKRRAVDASIESSLHSARVAMESYFEAHGYTYQGADEGILADEHGYRAATGFTLNILTTTPTGYVLRGCQTGANYPSWVYDSDVGALLGNGSPCS
jgi:prepilin-type N-terminal cleavage/methylation domain-containing protein